MKKALIISLFFGISMFAFGQGSDYAKIDSFRYWGTQDADFTQACKIITMGGVYDGATIIILQDHAVGYTFSHGALHLEPGHRIFQWKDGKTYLAISGDELINFGEYTPLFDSKYSPEEKVAYARQVTGVNINPAYVVNTPTRYVYIYPKQPKVRFYVRGEIFGSQVMITNDPYRSYGYGWYNQPWMNTAPYIWGR